MHGFLNLNKPVGISSHAVTAFARRCLKFQKIGHLGTLDPAASGVLVLALGAATKLVEFLIHLPKIYLAEIKFGCESSTYDLAGEVRETPNVQSFAKADLLKILPEFTGRILQIPPKFSALKIRGQPAYIRARRGEEFSLAARSVTITALEVEHFAWPFVRLRIACSGGTYVRSLAHDLGVRLQTGAVLSKLKRLAVGDFLLANSLLLSQISSAKVLPITSGIKFPKINLTKSEAQKILCGQKIPVRNPPGSSLLIGCSAQNFLAILEFDSQKNLLKPKKVLVLSD